MDTNANEHLTRRILPPGFADTFTPYVGHGPDSRWGGCWLTDITAKDDLAGFMFTCPGDTSLLIRAQASSESAESFVLTASGNAGQLRTDLVRQRLAALLAAPADPTEPIPRQHALRQSSEPTFARVLARWWWLGALVIMSLFALRATATGRAK